MARKDARAAPWGQPQDEKAAKLITSPRSLSKVTRDVAPDTRRRVLDGPVVGDLAEVVGPHLAEHDAAWAAKVLAGYARDAAELEDWLHMTGLLAAPWAPPRTGVMR